MKVQESLDKLAIIANQKLKEREYWINKLSGEPVKSTFPYDGEEKGASRIDEKKTDVDTIKTRFQAHLFQRLMKISGKNDYTLHVILAAGVAALLNRYTGHQDITVVTPIYKQALEGEFINTVLPLRVQLKEKSTVKDLLIQVKQTVVEAVDHQSYPVKTLMESLNQHQQQRAGTGVLDTAILLRNIQQEKDITPADPSMIFSCLRTDGYLEVVVHYCPSLYRHSSVQRIILHLEQLLINAFKDENACLSQVEIVPELEKQHLLEVLNLTDIDYPRDKTIHRLFEEQVEKTPDRIAVIGVLPGERSAVYALPFALTYRELNKKANQLAQILHEKGIKPDTIAAIMLERSVDMIIGIMGILKAGGAYLPIDPDYPQVRIDYMLADSNASVLLATEVTEFTEREICTKTSVISVTSVAKRNQLAYIIYTSGTTGKPKGMMIEQRNVVRLMFNDKYLFDFNPNDIWTLFHSFCFDFSVWEMYGALLYGGQLVVIPKMAARDSRAYLEILKEKQVTILNKTPSAFYHLMNLELKELKKELNIRYVIFGGEALNPDRLQEWKARYPAAKLVNMYGITETTVHVTFKELSETEIESAVSNIGKPIPTLSTYVMDKNFRLLPVGVVGELCVGGEGVGRGYVNRPELTARKFVKNPYKPGRLYISGDLVKILDNRDLEYRGRMDHQVKIRGFRIELGEIESRLLRHGEIKEALIISREDQYEDKYLCAYIISPKELDLPGLRKFLAAELPDYMIPSYFVRLERLPLTPNGKVDHKALPLPEVKPGGGYLPPRDELEEKLVEIWARILGIEKDVIGIDTNFFQLGGHSLKAALMANMMHKELNVKMPLAEVFRTPTIRELSENIKGMGLNKDEYTSIKSAEEKDYYPLFSGQKRLYVLQQMAKTSAAYNMLTVVELDGTIHKQRFEESFMTLINRHDSLRTSFMMLGDEPVQRIHDKVGFKIEYHEPTHTAQSAVENFIRPFNLSQAPLLRVGVIRLKKNSHILIADMHHIISDGISEDILVHEFIAGYAGKELLPLRLQYKDYSEWRSSPEIQAAIKKQETFWLKEFELQIPDSNLPLDFPRPEIQPFEGDVIGFEIDKGETQGLKELALNEDATLFMVLLTIYNVLLAKLSGQQDIVVGTGVAGRRHEDLQPIIGMFVNTLAIRTFPLREKTFNEFLSEVKTKTTLVFENQDYPFEELVEKVAPGKILNRNPLFDTAFVFNKPEAESRGTAAVELPGLIVKPYENEYTVSRFDMTFFVNQSTETLMVGVEYSTKLFKKETITMFIDYFNQITTIVAANSEILLKDIALTQDIRAVDTEAPQYAFQF